MPDTRADIGIKVDENQVRRFCAIQQLQRIANADVQAWIVIQPKVFDGQARHVRAQFDGFDVFQRQELEAGLGQRTRAETKE
ncbi:hypothetical protein D3C86_1321990 [compost metagenome]